MKKEDEKITATDLVKWANISVLLTGNRNTIRDDRDNKRHHEQIQPLLDMIQEWVDTKGHPSWANSEEINIIEEVEIDGEPAVKTTNINKKSGVVQTQVSKGNLPTPYKKFKTDESYEVVDQVPLGRKPVTDTGYRGLYEFEGCFYTNKIHDNKLEIRKYASRSGAEKYLESLKS